MATVAHALSRDYDGDPFQRAICTESHKRQGQHRARDRARRPVRFARMSPSRPTPQNISKLRGEKAVGTWQLNRDDQGYRDDLAFTFRR